MDKNEYHVKLVATKDKFRKFKTKVRTSEGIWRTTFYGNALLNKLSFFIEADELAICGCTLQIIDEEWVLVSEGRTTSYPVLFVIDGRTLKALHWWDVPQEVKTKVVAQCVLNKL